MIKSRVFLADDVRVEKGSEKPILIGLYTDETILVNLDEKAPDPTRDAAAAMPQIAMLVTVAPNQLPAGSVEGTLTILGPDKQPLIDGVAQQIVTGDPKRPTNLVLTMPGFPVVGFGVYSFKLVIGNDAAEWQITFERRHAPVGAQ